MHEKIVIEILKTYSPVVRSIAGQLNAKTLSKKNMDIFVQVGWIGFLDAIIFFNPGKGEFKNFVGRKIKGQIYDFQDGLDQISVGQRNRNTLLNEAKNRCDQLKSEPSSLVETAKKINVSLDEYSFVLSLLELCQRKELDKIKLAINSNTLDSNKDHSLLVSAIKKLGNQEKIAVGLLYEKELNLQDTGRVLELSEARVFQLLKVIIEKLQKALSHTQPVPPPGDKVMQQMMRDIKCLNTLEKRILMLHHSKKVNNRDIPTELGISGTRVRQIYQIAIKKLRARIPH